MKDFPGGQMRSDSRDKKYEKLVKSFGIYPRSIFPLSSFVSFDAFAVPGTERARELLPG